MSTSPGTVLILGADGFIGRHLAFGLRAAGWKVIACARRTARLERMGFDVLEADKRPVMAEGDGSSVQNVDWVEIRSEPAIAHRILFDPGHGLEERLISEQFT